MVALRKKRRSTPSSTKMTFAARHQSLMDSVYALSVLCSFGWIMLQYWLLIVHIDSKKYDVSKKSNYKNSKKNFLIKNQLNNMHN